MAQTENLTIMFTDMVGFTERTSRQSRAQNKTLLQQQERLLMPVITRFGGRRIKSIGDAFLITFRSPTDAVRCGMALHDTLAEFNAPLADMEQVHIRVAINVGEVRLEGKDVFGEPVNVAARVEGITPADEIYFTEAVYLAMNKAEVPFEALGSEKLKGIPEPVKLFRVPSYQINRLVSGGERLEIGPGELPFGGMHRQSSEQLTQRRWVEALRSMSSRIERFVLETKEKKQLIRVLAVGLLILATVVAGYWGLSIRRATSETQTTTAVSETALKALQQGHSAFAQGRRAEAMQYYEQALKLNPELQDDPLLATHLVAGLSWSSDLAAPLIRKYPHANVIKALVRRTTQPGALGRRRASGLLNELGHADQVDRTLLAITDLQESRTCEDKLEAIKRLRKLRDVRALPALKHSKGTGFGDWWKNRCLRDEADAAISEIKQRSSRQGLKS